VKIRCSFTVDVDPDAWALEYGTSADRRAVREDVQSHAEHSFYAHLEQLGLIAQPESRPF